jgi:methyl-accepting chemotaxis protein
MNSISLPAMGNLGIRPKLWLVILVLTLPIVALVYSVYDARNADISLAESEAHGLDYVASVNAFLQDVQTHRVLAQQVLAGDLASVEPLKSATNTADAHYSALLNIDKKYGGQFETASLVSVIKDQWPALRDTPQGQELSANSDAHTRLIDDGILPLISRVANNSKLSLDPQVDSSNVIGALTVSLPQMTEALSRAQTFSAGAMLQSQGESPTDVQQQYVAGQLLLAGNASNAMTRQLQSAMAVNKDFETALQSPLRTSTSGLTNFTDLANADIVNARALDPKLTSTMQVLGSNAVESANKLLTAAQQGLKSNFDDRRGSAQSALIYTGLAAFGGIAVAVVLALIIAQSITRPIARLAEVADRMSLGELDIEIDVTGANEVGQLAESLRRMQASLRSAIERLRVRRAA